MLSPILKDQFFVEIKGPSAASHSIISSYRHSLPPSPFIDNDLIQAMLTGLRPPAKAFKIFQLGSLSQLKVPDDARPALEELFRKSSNGKGYLTVLEAADLLTAANLDRSQLSYIWDAILSGGNGRIDESAFLRAMWLVKILHSLLFGETSTANDDSSQIDGRLQIRWFSPTYMVVCKVCTIRIQEGESCRRCIICVSGGYDLCESCFDNGNKTCTHELKRLWLAKRLNYPTRWSTSYIACDTCRKYLQPGEFCFWCKVCRKGNLDLCHECHSKKAYNCTHYPLPLCIIRKSTPPAATNRGNNSLASLANKINAQTDNAIDKTGRAFQSLQLKESLQGSIITEKPNVQWDDVAGLESAKQELQEAVIFPVRFPQMYQGKRKARRAILLYGPPGTGKSYLAKAVATECDSTLLSISSSDLTSKWTGESEGLVRNLFKLAREKKPSIIFIDEIDALAGRRDGIGSGGENTARIKTEFLVQMDGLGNDNEGVLILAATNLPWSLDPAVRRRFQKRIHIPLPDLAARKDLFEIFARDMTMDMMDEDFEKLAQRTEGFSGSDITVACQDALAEPVKRVQKATHFNTVNTEDGQWYTPCDANAPGAMPMTWRSVPPERLKEPPLKPDDSFTALSRVKPSVGQEDIRRCYEWTQEFGLEGA